MPKIQKIAVLALCTAMFLACEKEDVRETKHYNGIRKTQVTYKNGVPHGEFKRWTSHGDLAESGFYKEGLREGEWTEWFTSGKVQARGNYEHDMQQGLWTGYFYDGKIAFEHFYKDGNPIGIWTEYYSSGKVKEKNSCHKSAKAGTREVYAESGILERLEHCKNGILHGTVETNYPGGSLETRERYVDGTLEGKAELYRACGELWRTSYYKFGRRESIWTYYAKDGSVQKTSRFKDGNGIAYGELGTDGIDAETTFVNNRVQDSIRYTLPGRNLRFIEVWENDEKVKSLAKYAQNNHLASEGNFQNGKRNGFWRNWYENGKIKDSLIYKDDELFGEQLYYDSTGKLYMRKNQFGKSAMQVDFK